MGFRDFIKRGIVSVSEKSKMKTRLLILVNAVNDNADCWGDFFSSFIYFICLSFYLFWSRKCCFQFLGVLILKFQRALRWMQLSKLSKIDRDVRRAVSPSGLRTVSLYTSGTYAWCHTETIYEEKGRKTKSSEAPASCKGIMHALPETHF